MKKILKQFEKDITLICKRPGMYTGDKTLSSLQIYVNGLCRGMDICGIFTMDDWRQWVYSNYPNTKNASWATVLLDEFGSEGEVINRIPMLFSKFISEID